MNSHKDDHSNMVRVVPLRKEFALSIERNFDKRVKKQQLYNTNEFSANSYMVRRHGCALEMMAVRNVDYKT